MVIDPRGLIRIFYTAFTPEFLSLCQTYSDQNGTRTIYYSNPQFDVSKQAANYETYCTRHKRLGVYLLVRVASAAMSICGFAMGKYDFELFFWSFLGCLIFNAVFIFRLIFLFAVDRMVLLDVWDYTSIPEAII